MTTGIALTSPRPNCRDGPLTGLGQPEAHVVHLHDEPDGPVDAGGDRDGDRDEDHGAREQRLVGDLVERDHHDLRREDEVRADRLADEGVLVRALLALGRVPPWECPLIVSHSFSAPS
jgi:hypothetical protein